MIQSEFDSKVFNVENSQTIDRKYSKETQDLNNKSTNIASTLEATLGENKLKIREAKVMENVTDNNKLKKFRILKNQKRFKPTSTEDSFRDIRNKINQSKQKMHAEQIELSSSNIDSSLYNASGNKTKLPPLEFKKVECKFLHFNNS